MKASKPWFDDDFKGARKTITKKKVMKKRSQFHEVETESLEKIIRGPWIHFLENTREKNSNRINQLKSIKLLVS